MRVRGRLTLAIATGLLVVPVAALAAKHNGHQHAPGPGGGHPSQPWHPGAQGGHPGAPGGHPGSQGDHQPGGQDGGPGGQPGGPTPG
ncbi:MAG TPA: glycosyl transferase family 39, partial [Actinomycetota bacterium]|nr:glycosyl transferase family 39 [Actinomycetota bacterium]